jgi:Protein of unknown function (DUF2393)
MPEPTENSHLEMMERPPERRERNWLPLGIAGGLVLVVVVAGLVLSGHRKPALEITPANAALDPYATQLALSNVAMSESSNLAGGKVTYIDGHIANHGSRTVTAIAVQVLFHSYTHQIAQNDTVPLQIIRMREPYIDTAPIAAQPLKAGAEQDFRLIFDKVSPDWAGEIPELRILRVETR